MKRKGTPIECRDANHNLNIADILRLANQEAARRDRTAYFEALCLSPYYPNPRQLRLINCWRDLQACGAAYPSWTNWCEFALETSSGPITVVYCPPDMEHIYHMAEFHFYGPAISPTGYRCYFLLVENVPRGTPITTFAREMALSFILDHRHTEALESDDD